MKSFLSLLIIVFYTCNLTAGVNLACGGSSLAKRLTLNNPSIHNSLCVYEIRPTSSRVCQVRFDLNNFSLAQPSILTYPLCVTDEFVVGDIKLCGENSGQHCKFFLKLIL